MVVSATLLTFRASLVDPRTQFGKLRLCRPPFREFCHGLRDGSDDGADRLNRRRYRFHCCTATRTELWSGRREPERKSPSRLTTNSSSNLPNRGPSRRMAPASAQVFLRSVTLCGEAYGGCESGLKERDRYRAQIAQSAVALERTAATFGSRVCFVCLSLANIQPGDMVVKAKHAVSVSQGEHSHRLSPPE